MSHSSGSIRDTWRFHGAWGAQWYAMQAGAEVAAVGDSPPDPGDVLVASVGTPGARPGNEMALEPQIVAWRVVL